MGSTLSRSLIAAAALLLAAATGLGAVASHLLASTLTAEALHAFETAVEYQFIHALGLMGIAIYGQRAGRSRLLTISALIVLAGVILFCAGVYTSSLGGPHAIARLAPTGGVALIVGWLAVAIAVIRGGFRS